MPNAEITALLGAWEKGDDQALSRVITLVYDELRRIARFYLDGPSARQTLQPTALVHEVYERLAGAGKLAFENRAHFFNCARMIMRQVLMRQARRQQMSDGNKRQKADFDEANFLQNMGEPDPQMLLALEQALEKLAEIDQRSLAIVELRFFVGLNIEETAAVLEISPRTVRREWAMSKRWLAKALGSDSQT